MLMLKKIKGPFQSIEFLKLFSSENIFANTADNIAGAVGFFFRPTSKILFFKIIS